MIDNRREMGDWQTPLEFATLCCRIISDTYGFMPAHIIEPTCGIGNFIEAARNVFVDTPVLGIEINEAYIDYLNQRFSEDDLVEIYQANYLQETRPMETTAAHSTLVLGNPPWVTNSTLSSLGSGNLPEKRNFKGLRGIDAMTGESNFDICEWIILHALNTFSGDDDMLAMLCKTSVARNVCIELAKAGAKTACTMLSFDSKKIFDISAAACLLICDFRAEELRICQGDIAEPDVTTDLVFTGKGLREVLPDEIASFHGSSVLTWRQGVKHDCGRVMELQRTSAGFINKLGESVCIEDDFIYPYVKSSKSRHLVIKDDDVTMAVPMTQHIIGEDTSHLEADAPLFWQYLQKHSDLFDARKSSIYRNAPRFAMFGVGDYSYAKYKVAVSGFYKEPVFAIAYGKKPIMFDDTCYFLPFNNVGDARVCMLLLNSPSVKRYYSTIAFLDSKRPYSKKVLSQLDFAAALNSVGINGLNDTAEVLGLPFRISNEEFQQFSVLVSTSLF
ncbi:methyltransferase [Eggerthellaceae bacterium zg-887]|uniref:methyltransferase n=1 Tax=Xiamenia xianingshaonis TaxID=2682776 RepID=UPI001409F04F|nr:methyltransferase [Xiamenia xianingshaonis]NHM15267.1 methyltransferase [Xiamenia xianingshaonis]